MKILRWSELVATPWKNGLGITREIARKQAGEQFFWRISVADVSKDGPFSIFQGLQRVLTVIDGEGMVLKGITEIFQADLGVPVAFDGSLEITAHLKQGPVRDLNLIFDPQYCHGSVRCIRGNEVIHCAHEGMSALFCMKGSVALNQLDFLAQGDTAFLDIGQANVELATGSYALLVSVESKTSL